MQNRCKTRTEMADEYMVDRKTFRVMVKKSGILLTSGLITPLEQKEIYEKLGNPKSQQDV